MCRSNIRTGKQKKIIMQNSNINNNQNYIYNKMQKIWKFLKIIFSLFFLFIIAIIRIIFGFQIYIIKEIFKTINEVMPVNYKYITKLLEVITIILIICIHLVYIFIIIISFKILNYNKNY